MRYSDGDLSRAIVLLIGLGFEKVPTIDSKRLLKEFDLEAAKALEPLASVIINQIMETKIDWKKETLQSATEVAEAKICHLHPEFSVEAVRALGWYFSWNWR